MIVWQITEVWTIPKWQTAASLTLLLLGHISYFYFKDCFSGICFYLTVDRLLAHQDASATEIVCLVYLTSLQFTVVSCCLCSSLLTKKSPFCNVTPLAFSVIRSTTNVSAILDWVGFACLLVLCGKSAVWFASSCDSRLIHPGVSSSGGETNLLCFHGC